MKSLIFWFAIVLMCTAGCKSSKYATGEYNYISKPSKDVIRIRSTGYSNKKYFKFLGICWAKRKQSALKNAEVRVIENILFDGISGSEIYYPLIHPTEQVNAKRNGFIQSLLLSSDYMKYVKRSDDNLFFAFDRQSKRTRVETLLDVNITSLRKDLKNHGIIKKFGL